MKEKLSIHRKISLDLTSVAYMSPFHRVGIMVTLIGLLVAMPILMAQDATTPVAPNPNAINEDGGVLMQEYIIDDFENADLWFGGMWIDDGVIQVRKVFGAPEQIRQTQTVSQETQYALGGKISFLRRSFSSASIEPPREVSIPGITEKLSIWVQGRGVGHELFAVIRDFEGKVYKVSFGKIDFTGWRKMEAKIPGRITQENDVFSTYYRRQGIAFIALYLDFVQKDTVGTYFVYFDNLIAHTNVYLYEEQIKNENLVDEDRIDPIDNW